MNRSRTGRQYYLEDVPLEEAVLRFDAALREAGALGYTASQKIPVQDANGRVTADTVWARTSVPHYDAAAMDGVAVRSRDTVGATETSPLKLTVGNQAVWIDTGDPMPDEFDAVVMVEVVHEVDDSTIELQAPVAPYEHVRPLGEDIVATELLVPRGHRLKPYDVAACAASGLTEVLVRCPPSVTIIPTGNELVPVGEACRRGEIPEFNSLMLAGMVSDWGGSPRRLDPVPDSFDSLRDSLSSALEHSDVVVINAGSSAGSEDYTARVVESLGDVIVHGVAIRPGHPVVLGVVNGKAVLGIPGYPVSAAVTSEQFLKPLVCHMLGVSMDHHVHTSARMVRKVTSPPGEEEFLRVRVGRVGDKMVAAPIQRGAGVVTSLVKADGIVRIPRFSEGVEAGDEVSVELRRPMDTLLRTVLVVGSHDMILDLLASELSRTHPDMNLASSNVGSLGGLLALKRGESHMAGCHLMDEDSGEYNTSFVRRYLPGRGVVLVNLVRRIQGLMVQRGNVKQVQSLSDLTRADLRFANRQRGSGTRVLLDFMLRDNRIPPAAIRGYEREEYTHLSVAAAIAGGSVDVGLGVFSAARALGLDFVPLQSEEYDLIIPVEFYEGDLMKVVLDLVRDIGFRELVDELGGYDTTSMGEVVAEIT